MKKYLTRVIAGILSALKPASSMQVSNVIPDGVKLIVFISKEIKRHMTICFE